MQILKGHTTGKPVYGLAFAPIGNSLASSCLDGTIRLWDLTTGENQIVNRSTSQFVAYSPSGRQLLYKGRLEAILLDLLSQGRSRLQPGARGSTLFSADGKMLMASAGRHLHFHDAGTGDRQSTVTYDGVSVIDVKAVSRDGRRVAASGWIANPGQGGHSYPVLLLEYPSGREIDQLHAATNNVNSLAFSPDGRLLAAAASATLIVWELPGGKIVFRDQPDRRHFNRVDFSPDGKWLAAAHNDNCVRLYDTLAWSPRETLDWKIGPIVSVCFAPDGMRAAGGSRRGKIVVWDVDP